MHLFQGYKIGIFAKRYIGFGKPRTEHRAPGPTNDWLKLFTFVDLLLLVTINICPQKFNLHSADTNCLSKEWIFEDWDSVNVKRSKVEFNCDTLAKTRASWKCQLNFILSYQWVANGRDSDWFLFESVLAAMVSVAGRKISSNNSENNNKIGKNSNEIWLIYHVDNIKCWTAVEKREQMCVHNIFGVRFE